MTAGQRYPTKISRSLPGPLIEIDAQDQASILRHTVATGVVMVTCPLTARHRDVGPIHALTAAVRALNPRQPPDLQDLAVKPGS